MRQFDVFVWGGETETFEDPALGWFFTDHFNQRLNESNAEWIVFAKNTLKINREFLNNLAETITGFPMVDAFAPRIKDKDFSSGFILDKKKGLTMIGVDAPLRYVACPNPEIAVFSRRIVQRIGKFDEFLPIELQIVDSSLRMLHAGGNCFSVPYLVVERKNLDESTPAEWLMDSKNLAYVLKKNLGAKSLSFQIRHPSSISFLWKHRKMLQEKRDAAILLSKLKPDFLKKI